jgi:hypothetical protein
MEQKLLETNYRWKFDIGKRWHFRTKDKALARQVLYHLSHALFGFSYFSHRVSGFCPAQPQNTVLLPTPLV